MPLVQLRAKSQITIPSSIRKELGIKNGDYLEIRKEGDRIIIVPKIVVDKSMVTLSEKGEKYLQEALDDMKEGRIKANNDVEEFIDNLKR
ncbi:MAG: AbrB/MazE/SpoVT family DNA-binding domain-containing protein [Atribacterota bacterium]|jgi:AbrB family looped-hinge helix DNA binding protein|nr:AbrB/MazE/SpoVT family DNA-binding domain-containing protein [Atribacterota bacterium]